ncbi:S8 family serine peptidase [Leptolyngbya sp. 7M]|uniref:S8 family serine peptidase n=1 Tax=Leptolyngbya sp. 7M TaxID=2812896 RepID=UPI001B8A9C4E|nr:S8 family serine peptidase [Leptolyngbya sp. 7M]QYO65950.1 S8 family serine peptidase [Leptolyngbya sp. 7M]
MNKSNIWIHLTVAIVLVTFAAILGQIDRWRAALRSINTETQKTVQKPKTVRRSGTQAEPEVLVRFKPHVSLTEKRKITARLNDRIEDRIELVRGMVAIDDLDDADPSKVAAEYSAMTEFVEYAEPNYEIKPELPAFREVLRRPADQDTPVNTPNDPHFSDQWALYNSGQNGGKANADVSALKAWQKNRGSKDVVVAVLDTGVDYTHADLAANMWFRPETVPSYVDAELGTFNDRRGFNAVDNISDPMDDNGHGTHCAGVIGAEGNNEIGIAGINWNVQIMPLKFLGRGGFGSTKDAIEAINYAVDRKKNGVNVRVISASWGSTQYSKALEDAIRAAGDEGILFVAAAGNNSGDNDKRPHYPSNYDLPNVISVAALDSSDLLASFSNFGAKTVHVAAPGKEIVSTWLNDGFREASGTSMATPHVAGIAALIIANEPEISVKDLREKILSSVDRIDVLNGRIFSAGRINAAKALGH